MIKGTYKGKLVERCCEEGEWTLTEIRSSGCSYCKHTGYTTFWDDFGGYYKTLPEITDEKIIKLLEEKYGSTTEDTNGNSR